MKEDRLAREHACSKQKKMLSMPSVKGMVKTLGTAGLSFMPFLAKSGNSLALNSSLKILILKTSLPKKISTGL